MYSQLITSLFQQTFLASQAIALWHNFPFLQAHSANFLYKMRTFVRVLVYYNTLNMTTLCLFYKVFTDFGKFFHKIPIREAHPAAYILRIENQPTVYIPHIGKPHLSRRFHLEILKNKTQEKFSSFYCFFFEIVV